MSLLGLRPLLRTPERRRRVEARRGLRSPPRPAPRLRTFPLSTDRRTVSSAAHAPLLAATASSALVGQYAFGACPGHPFLLAVLRAVATAHAHPGWAHVPATPPGGDDRTVLYTTGPALVTRARLARTRLLTPEAEPWPWH